MKLWKYIEAHHEEYGAGLFVVPAAVVIFLIFGLIYLAAECIAYWG